MNTPRMQRIQRKSENYYSSGFRKIALVALLLLDTAARVPEILSGGGDLRFVGALRF